MFLQPQYLQTALGHSALAAGVLILPVTAPMIAISPLGGRLIARFGVRSLMTVGMALGSAGLVVLAQVDSDSGYALLFPGYLLFGLALGFVYAPMSTAAMTAMPPAKAGIAAGVLGMNRVLAGAITLAAAGAVFQAVLDDDRHAGEADPAAFASALSSLDVAARGTVRARHGAHVGVRARERRSGRSRASGASSLPPAVARRLTVSGGGRTSARRRPAPSRCRRAHRPSPGRSEHP